MTHRNSNTTLVSHTDHPTVNILGVTIHCVDFAATLDQIEQWIGECPSPPAPRYPPPSPCHQICTANPEFVIDARRDPAFAQVLRNADLCVPDGSGLLWAARLQGIKLNERVTGSDGIYRICERAAQKRWRVFFLGAKPGVAQAAAERLQKRYPGLHVAGSYAGNPTDQEWPTILPRLAEAQADILFVAYGHPKQDFWIAKHKDELPVKVAIGIGGAFDFVAGVLQRAPLWMQRLSLEWLYRLIQEPWRLWRMMKIPIFMGLLLMAFLRKNLGNSQD